jgi:hypothetical protein
MSTSKISFEDFLRLPPDNHGYELNEGELLAIPRQRRITTRSVIAYGVLLPIS